MKTAKMSTILVLALGLMVLPGRVSKAAPVGTAFTYQGNLNDAGSPADGLYDFQFKLYDDANTVTGNQVGSTIDINDLDVIDGYFTVVLDFGSDVFTGDARWLETTVAQSDGSDPCTLTPRVELTPTPYALHTRGLSLTSTENTLVGQDAGVSITTGYSNSAVGNRVLYSNTTGYNNSAVGNRALYSNITGSYNSAMGYRALYSNTTGSGNSAVGFQALYFNTKGSWNSAVGGYALFRNTTGSWNSVVGYEALKANTTGNYNTAMGHQANLYNQEGSRNTIIGYEAGRGTAFHNKSGNVFIGYKAGYYETGDNKLYIANDSADSNVLIYGDFSTGNVGIGTTSPAAKLEVNGEIKITDGSQGAGKVLTSDASGLASWQTPAGGGDNLGNHIATQNIRLNGHWLSGDGGNEGVFVDNAGNVGIGMTSPPQKLTVSGGNILVWAARPRLHLYKSNSSATIEGMNDGSFGSQLAFWTCTPGTGVGLERIRITGMGDVGIGTTTPSGKLQVAGDEVRIGDAGTINYANGDGDLYVEDALEVDGGVRMEYVAHFNISGAAVYITSSGHLGVLPSSKRYKENIVPLEDDFSNILEAQPVTFTLRQSKERGIGLIAEDLDELGLSNLVIYDNKGRPDSIRYEFISLYLLEVLKDQAKSINELKAENESLKKQLGAQNQSVKQRLEALERTVQQLTQGKEFEL